jgi:hypothetical protein
MMEVKKTAEGWVLSDEALEELLSVLKTKEEKKESWGEYCCDVFSGGHRIVRRTLSANSKGEAMVQCMSLMSDNGGDACSVGGGACS